MEALIRWQHPQLGLVTPNQFISLAEETGLNQLVSGYYKLLVSRTELQVAGLPPIRIAVNLSSSVSAAKFS